MALSVLLDASMNEANSLSQLIEVVKSIPGDPPSKEAIRAHSFQEFLDGRAAAADALPNKEPEASAKMTVTVPWDADLAALEEGEPFFVLKASDVVAPDIINEWCQRKQRDLNPLAAKQELVNRCNGIVETFKKWVDDKRIA